MRLQEEEEAEKLDEQKEKSLRYFPFLLHRPPVSPPSLPQLQSHCRWAQAGAVAGPPLLCRAVGERGKNQAFGEEECGTRPGTGSAVREELPIVRWVAVRCQCGARSAVCQGKAVPEPAGRAAPHLPRGEPSCPTHAAFTAPTWPLMVDLGRVASSVLGALLPGRRSDPGLNGSNRTGNGSVRGGEVTPEELSGALVLCGLQTDFQTRLSGLGHGCRWETQPVHGDLTAVQGAEQCWELCPLLGGALLSRLVFHFGWPWYLCS